MKLQNKITGIWAILALSFMFLNTQLSAQHMMDVNKIQPMQGQQHGNMQNTDHKMMNMGDMTKHMNDLVHQTEEMAKGMHGDEGHDMQGVDQGDMNMGMMSMGMSMSDMAKDMQKMMEGMNKLMADKKMMDNPEMKKQMDEIHKNMNDMIKSMDGMVESAKKIQNPESI